MSTFYKPFVVFIFLMGGLLPNLSLAAPRAADGNSKALAKLQAMVKEANVERDLLKTEASKMTAEIDQLKKDIASKSSNEERVSGELAAQKSSNAQVASTLQQTHAKLLEIIEKHNVINQSKNELSALHNDLKMSHTLKETELQNCESKNIKLYEAAEEVLNAYEHNSLFDSLLESEPVFQINSVQLESIVQEYEDKLRKQKYVKSAIKPTAENTTVVE